MQIHITHCICSCCSNSVWMFEKVCKKCAEIVEKVCRSIWYFARGVSVKSYRFADRLRPECDGPSACSSAQMEKVKFFRSIHLMNLSYYYCVFDSNIKCNCFRENDYEMEFSMQLWRKLVQGRSIGKAHSWNFGHNRKYFDVNILVCLQRNLLYRWTSIH